MHGPPYAAPFRLRDDLTQERLKLSVSKAFQRLREVLRKGNSGMLHGITIGHRRAGLPEYGNKAGMPAGVGDLISK